MLISSAISASHFLVSKIKLSRLAPTDTATATAMSIAGTGRIE